MSVFQFVSTGFSADTIQLTQNPDIISADYISKITLTDDPQPDTIKYCNPSGGWILNGPTNIWGATRFTPVTDFELRAAYIQVANPQNVGTRCNVYAMNAVPNGGPTGTPLASGYFQSPPSNQWVYVEFEIPVTFPANQEFCIVYGPTPAGPYPTSGGYWPAMDDAPTTNRNYFGTGASTPTYWSVCTYGDFMIMAGGEYNASFTDMQAVNCFHDTKKYWIMPGNSLNLKATIKNLGQTSVSNYSAYWQIFDEQGTSVFSNSVVSSGIISPNQTSVVSASQAWLALTSGRYDVKFYVDAPEDSNAADDTTWLELYISDLDDMPYTYVHEAVGGNVSATEWGITFNLPSTPARIDSFKVLMNETTVATFSVYLNDPITGEPYTSVWQNTMTVNSGWITLTPNDLNIFDDKFTVAYAGNGALSSSLTGINSAANDSMMTSTWINNGGWEKLYTGDWPFIVYLSESTAFPPEPIIALNDSSIDFGEVTVGDTGFFDLVIYNLGGEYDLILTAIMFNSPTGIFGINGFTPQYHIEAGDSAVFEMWFHPLAVQSYNYQWAIINNATSPAPLFGTVSGTGVQGSALTLTLTPSLPQIVIPSQGGAFTYDIVIHNNTTSPQTFDFWSQIFLPGSGSVPILQVNNASIPPSQTVTRARTQNIPAFAPGGIYTYYAYIGDYPWVITVQDSFQFTKTGVDGFARLGSPYDWFTTGDDFEEFTTEISIPGDFIFYPPSPNPFNNETILSFSIPSPQYVSLTVYDIQGREIAKVFDGYTPAGTSEVKFDASGLSSGFYFVKLAAPGFSKAQKLLLLK